MLSISRIEDLPMATSAELYHLSWVIEQLLADPRRIVQARSQLHLGQQVHYLDWGDGRWHKVRVVSMKNDRVTVLDEASAKQRSLPYAAIMTTDPTATPKGEQGAAPTQSRPSPPPEVSRRENVHVGQRVSFVDQNLQRHVGQVTRINQRTATVHADGRAWRVAFALLQPVINVPV